MENGADFGDVRRRWDGMICREMNGMMGLGYFIYFHWLCMTDVSRHCSGCFASSMEFHSSSPSSLSSPSQP